MVRVKIGDIIEVKSQIGFVYCQYTHRDKLFGALVRVYEEVYETRPLSFNDVIKGGILFSHFIPLSSMVKSKFVSVVANEAVPMVTQQYPIFRNGIADPETGRVAVWWFWDGEKEWKVGKITEQQRDYPILGVCNDTLFLERINNRWTPRDDPR